MSSSPRSAYMRFVRAAFVDAVDADLSFCNVCKVHPIHANSCATSCGHFVCSHCIPKYVDECPACSKPMSLLPVSPFIVKIVETRRVKCVFPGCDWRGLYGEAGAEFAAHYNQCGFADWSCPDCNALLTRSVKETHPATCPNRKVQCAHKCGQEFGLNDVEAHSAVCTHALVDCAFVRHGCSAVLKRRDVKKHNLDAMDQHSRFLLAKLDAFETKTSLLEKGFHDAQQVIASLIASSPPAVAKRGRGRPRKIPKAAPAIEAVDPRPRLRKNAPDAGVEAGSPRRKMPRKFNDFMAL